MNPLTRSGILLVGLLAAFPLTACRKEAAKPGGVPSGKVPVTAVTVETRDDGLAYLPGATEPFTGEAITPFPDTPWHIQHKEPYRAGKRDGDKVELFKKGTVKNIRRYEDGVPKYAASFHYNGQKKFELNLNAQDKGEGPYQRWYPDGTLESTAGLDAEERWHGVMQEWDEKGELKTHLIFEHGALMEVIFETPKSRAARLAVGLKLKGEEETEPAETDPAETEPAETEPAETEPDKTPEL